MNTTSSHIANKIKYNEKSKGKVVVVKKYCIIRMSEEKLFRAKEKIKE